MLLFEKIEKKWTEGAMGYDEHIQKQLSKKKDVDYWTKELRSLLGEEPLHILDVGCGPGFLTIILTRLGHTVKAIDGAQGMVNAAQKNFDAEGKGSVAALEDAVLLPDEEDASYDVIISRDVVWTLYDPETAFRRWKQVLKPGGKVLYYDGNYYSGDTSFRAHFQKAVGWISCLLLEHRIYGRSSLLPEGEFANLPFVLTDRPRKDYETCKKTGVRNIRITRDYYRTSLKNPEHWVYGWQGKKFRVLVTMPGGK